MSANVPTLSEQNRKNSAAQQASAFCHYGSDSIMAGQRFHRSALKRGKEAFLTPSPLMELKAKGVFAQRGAYQPFNVERSSSSSLMSPSTLPHRGFQLSVREAVWGNQTSEESLLIVRTVCFLWTQQERKNSARYNSQNYPFF